MTDYARLESHQRDPDCETTPRWILTNNKLLENVQNRTHTTHKARATGMTVLEREKTKRRKFFDFFSFACPGSFYFVCERMNDELNVLNSDSRFGQKKNKQNFFVCVLVAM